jgi:hypothetical protein
VQECQIGFNIGIRRFFRGTKMIGAKLFRVRMDYSDNAGGKAESVESD